MTGVDRSHSVMSMNGPAMGTMLNFDNLGSEKVAGALDLTLELGAEAESVFVHSIVPNCLAANHSDTAREVSGNKAIVESDSEGITVFASKSDGHMDSTRRWTLEENVLKSKSVCSNSTVKFYTDATVNVGELADTNQFHGVSIESDLKFDELLKISASESVPVGYNNRSASRNCMRNEKDGWRVLVKSNPVAMSVTAACTVTGNKTFSKLPKLIGTNRSLATNHNIDTVMEGKMELYRNSNESIGPEYCFKSASDKVELKWQLNTLYFEFSHDLNSLNKQASAVDTEISRTTIKRDKNMKLNYQPEFPANGKCRTEPAKIPLELKSTEGY